MYYTQGLCGMQRNLCMYLLKQIQDFENCEQIQALFSDLPKKPYCTDFKGFCEPRTKKHAIKHAYIQPNHPAVAQWLVFDLDYEQALFAYYDNNAPRPQLIIKNPKNGHAHYCYKLSEKVGLWGKSSAKVIEYLEAVYGALQRKLGADTSYAGNLIKNPAHKNWLTYITGAKKSYSLGELAEWLDLTEPKKVEPINDEKFYFGRNHEVFERTRHQAYPIANKYDYDRLYREILAIATAENAKFYNPMHPKELHHIAKSITRFCKSPRFGVYSVKFREKQRQRVAIANANGANSKGGKARSAKYDDKRLEAVRLYERGYICKEISVKLGVHRNTISKWLVK